MSERDQVAVLLRELDRPVAPRPEFRRELLDRLLAELEPPAVAPVSVRRRWPRLRPRRRLLLVFALAVIAAAIAVVVVGRPQKASALDVIRQARHAFATAPPFRATLRVDLNPDGTNRDVPKGAIATVEVSYGGRGRFRTQIVSERPRLPNTGGAGSYNVFDGRSIGSFDAKRNTFYSSEVPGDFQPLGFLTWQAGYPDWERVCRGADSKVLQGTRIAGRDARHIRCGDFRGDVWELWIDRQTGLLLRIAGQVGGDDFFIGGAPSTSAKGGFEVERVRYNPSFPASTFEVAAPRTAFDYRGRLQAAMRSVPPFSAVVYAGSGSRAYVDRVWWRNSQTWRRNIVVDHTGRGFGGPGSFLVRAGGAVAGYNAGDNTYSRDRVSEASNPVVELLPEVDASYSTLRCPIVGHVRIAGREAVHRHCEAADFWVDGSTGLALRKRGRGFELEIRKIEYDPVFPPGTFRFVPPPGSRNARHAEANPYFKTRLRPGQAVPNWRAAKLGGGTFQVADLRGKPALLLFFPAWCPAGDPVCDVFPQLEQAYEQSKDKVAVILVDFQGSAEEARKAVRHNHLTFPVVIDREGTSVKRWSIQGYPYWVLLDSQGRVIEARFKPQTLVQLRQLIARAK